MLTVHHLGISQSERIVWLCEELGIEYKLVRHERVNVLAPESLKSIPGNALEAAPLIQDGDITLAQSEAIAEYILTKYNPSGKLVLKPDDPNWTQYLYWFHLANGDLQPAAMNELMFTAAQVPDDNMFRGFVKMRWERVLRHVDDRLSTAKYLAGDEFTAADIMSAFTLSTQRNFVPFSLEEYPNILRWLQLIGSRDGYKRAMEKGDPGLPLCLDVKGPSKGLL